jgi:hypothetical protein
MSNIYSTNPARKFELVFLEQYFHQFAQYNWLESTIDLVDFVKAMSRSLPFEVLYFLFGAMPS